jgi:aminopeptidase
MSAKAYIVPHDHQSTGAVVEGLDAAKLWSLTPQGEKPPKVGTTRIFYNTPLPSEVTTLSSLGEGYTSKNANQKRELVRQSIGNAVKDLKKYDGIKDVVVDASLDPHAAGEQKLLLCSFAPLSRVFHSCGCSSGIVQVHLENVSSFSFRS